MLELDTPIPTERRSAIRTALRYKPDLDVWAMGLCPSRDLSNRMLIRFAIECGYAEEVEDLLTMPVDKMRNRQLWLAIS